MLTINLIPQIHTYYTQDGFRNQNNIINFFVNVLNANTYDNIYVFVEYSGSQLEADLMNQPQLVYEKYKDVNEPKELEELVEALGFTWYLLLFYYEEYRGKTKLNFEKSFLGKEIMLHDDILYQILKDVKLLFGRYNLVDEYLNLADIAYFLAPRDNKDMFIEHFREFFKNSTDPITKTKTFFDRFYSIFSHNNRQYVLDETREYLTINHIQSVIDAKHLQQKKSNKFFLVFGRLHNFENWNKYLKLYNFSFKIIRNVIDENEERLFPKYPDYDDPFQRVHSEIKLYIQNKND